MPGGAGPKAERQQGRDAHRAEADGDADQKARIRRHAREDPHAASYGAEQDQAARRKAAAGESVGLVHPVEGAVPHCGRQAQEARCAQGHGDGHAARHSQARQGGAIAAQVRQAQQQIVGGGGDIAGPQRISKARQGRASLTGLRDGEGIGAADRDQAPTARRQQEGGQFMEAQARHTLLQGQHGSRHDHKRHHRDQPAP